MTTIFKVVVTLYLIFAMFASAVALLSNGGRERLSRMNAFEVIKFFFMAPIYFVEVLLESKKNGN